MGAIGAPAEQHEVFPSYVKVFEFIAQQFTTHSTTGAYTDFFAQLKTLCNETLSELEHQLGDELELDNYLCFENLWDRLRVWLPSDTEPRKHPQARPPLIFAD